MKIPLIILATFLSAIHLCAQPAVVGAGYSAPYPIKVAPGQLVTLYVSGIDTTLTSRVSAESLPLPYSLEGISVTIDELIPPQSLKEKVPLLAVAPISAAFAGAPASNTIAVTVQIPYYIRTTSYISPLTPPPATLTVYRYGIAATTVAIAPVVDQVHIATTCDSNIATPVAGALCRPLITHADGSLVTPDQPAHPSELLVLYAFGLGAAPPGVVTGEASPAQPETMTLLPRLLFGPAISTRSGERNSVEPVFAGLAAGFAGLYQINFFAPQPPPQFAPADCTTFTSPNGNVAVTLSGQVSADTASFCVYP